MTTQYSSIPHVMASISRKVVAYDPYELTDNDSFRELMVNAWSENSSAEVLSEVLSNEFDLMDSRISMIPLSYQLVLKSIDLMWNNLIIAALFDDAMYEDFADEYGEVILGILNNDTPDCKEFYVYRSANGETMFDIAAKIYILSMVDMYDGDDIEMAISEAINTVLVAYRDIGSYMESETLICNFTDLDGYTTEEKILQLKTVILEEELPDGQ